MNISKGIAFLPTFKYWFFVLLAGAAVWLSGCASQPNAQGATPGRTEIVTDSDESSDRKRARIRIELASGYFEQGKSNIALDEIKLAILADPTFPDAYSLRGLVYMRLNDFGFAEESFNKALALKPGDGNVLHNLGWMKCQQTLYPQAFSYFTSALNDPLYSGRAKTLMTQGLCQIRAGLRPQGEASLLKSYEFDAGNPVTGYNLANLLYQNKDFVRARFYIRRINNSELANAETLWLGIKIEKQLGNTENVTQLALQLEKRFSQSPETAAYRRGDFND
ncbi:MAG: type IV pilus biogenesis/stability protein PilW [Rhodoferax sp.]|nr:type IV pilus biogenesis/stability protein PilW [Betaproteobacteria bacterium]NCN96394.1 type IV pilus biogenesis/stability protein PilW [Rhodoferax sp.]PIZ22080.1 MAG: type IV pilus biogenesis/stability protein PilW [Comamonadaceae bacterium CG_4_10_14_0_8_um_filter_57_29]PJC17613.1 MAG: type IV pilus biogenesis/stability protein PilW [Comamonadaceae bacterium CG_4_9_14_0_8_um_filter_57_21]NCP82438.1 type IV pilus biogenesis/stability protein PilW [Rhodoferax sp.]